MKAPWLHIALDELLLGVQEVPGPGSNSRINLYLATVGMAPDDEISWCSGFGNYCLIESGCPGTGKPNARSFLSWGVPCGPVPGAVCILWRGSPGGWQGHVGFLLWVSATHVYLLAGNQQDAVSVAPFPLDRVLGYRVPKGD